MHACKCGSGRTDAGGCASAAQAEEPVQGRGMDEAVCSQVSAGSDAWRTYRWVICAKARVVFLSCFCSLIHYGNNRQTFTVHHTSNDWKSEEKFTNA